MTKRLQHLVLTSSGRLGLVTLPWELHHYQAAVGGLIDYVGDDTHSMFINDEGKLEGLPRNTVASLYAHSQGWIDVTDHICGNVVFIGPPDHVGDTTEMSSDLMTDLLLNIPNLIGIAMAGLYEQKARARR